MAVTLDQQGMHALEARCSQDNPPRCQVLCPFNVDIKGVLVQLGKGNAREARKLLQRVLPLPGIMSRICEHPCESSCLRANLGGPLAIGSLEAWLVREEPVAGAGFPVRRKSQTMAIMGTGVAGLVCAADLAGKGYTVVCCHTGTPESALQAQFPKLAEEWDDQRGPAAEWAALAGKVTFREVPALDQALLDELCASADAVFVDASQCDIAPAREACDPLTLLWQEGDSKVCAGGWKETTPTGHTFVSAARSGGEGRTAAVTMERLATHVSLTASREREIRSPAMILDGIEPSPRLVPHEGTLTREEVQAEARRCLECQCLICVKACAYMQKYKGYPRVFARMIFNNLTIAQGIRKANSLIDSCALCRQCEELCPEHFSMADLCLAAREDMVHKGFMPQSAFEFAMEDMESASTDPCLFVHPGARTETPAQVFFPGCQLTGCRPDQVAAVYQYLADTLPGGTGIYLSCCGIPAHWAGETKRFAEHVAAMKEALARMGNPRLITACSSCLSIFREFLPELESVSLWEVLDNQALPAARADRADHPQTLVVQDPCSARRDEGWQKAVRSLAKKCGVEVTEPELTGRTTACCGYGGNQWCSDPEAARQMARLRAEGLGGPSLASCIMCRERIADQGVACWHILDLLPFGQACDQTGAKDSTSLSARRAARAKVRRLLTHVLAGEVIPEPVPQARMRYAEEMLRKLEEKHILQEDVEATLAFGERSGAFFEDLDSGHRLTSYRPRNVTFWVEYTQDEDGTYVVHEAWCHRMRVPGAGGEVASTAFAKQTEDERGRISGSR